MEATPYRYQTHNFAFAVNQPTYDLKPLLPKISCPTLVTVGRHDWITPVSSSQTIASLIPDARLVVFEKVRALAAGRGGDEVPARCPRVPPYRGMIPLTMYDLDIIDRRIVAALLVNGRASWTDIATLTGTSVTTVARRAQQLLADLLVRIAAVPYPTGQSGADMLIVRLRCAPGTQLDVGAALAALPQVRFVALVTGEYDLVAEVVVPKGGHLHTLLVDGLQRIPGVQRSVADLELHTYKATHGWSLQLLGDAADLVAPQPIHDCEPGHLDELDKKIVDALRIDGRASFQAVAAGLGVSESTVRRRFEALYTTGCVQIITLVPAAALGFEAEMFFWLSVAPARLEAVAHELAAQLGVRYVAATLGQESLMCEVILPTHEDVYQFTTITLAGIEGIHAWTANVELLTLKRGFVPTPWSSAWRGEVRPPSPTTRSPRTRRPSSART